MVHPFLLERFVMTSYAGYRWYKVNFVVDYGDYAELRTINWFGLNMKDTAEDFYSTISIVGARISIRGMHYKGSAQDFYDIYGLPGQMNLFDDEDTVS